MNFSLQLTKRYEPAKYRPIGPEEKSGLDMGWVDPKWPLTPWITVLTIGTQGGGKTTSLIDFTSMRYRVGEMTIVRMDPNLEMLGLATIHPAILHVPKGTEFMIDPPPAYLEVKEFSITENLAELFHNMRDGVINLIGYDNFFNFDREISIVFWHLFIGQLMQKAHTSWRSRRFTLTFDELRDIVPERGARFSQGIQRKSKEIYNYFRRFRKARLSLLASSQNYNDILKDFRTQFGYLLFFNTPEEGVPDKDEIALVDRFKKVITSLPVPDPESRTPQEIRSVIYSRRGARGYLPNKIAYYRFIPEVLTRLDWEASFTSPASKVEEELTSQRQIRQRQAIARLAYVFKEMGANREVLRRAMNLQTQQAISQLFKQYRTYLDDPLVRDELDAIVAVMRQAEEPEEKVAKVGAPIQ